MMPVVPSAKKPNDFSIDSLMGKDSSRNRSTSAASLLGTCPSVSLAASSCHGLSRDSSLGGVGSSFHPVTASAGLLNGINKSLCSAHEASFADGLAGLTGHYGMASLPGGAGLHHAHGLPPVSSVHASPHTGFTSHLHPALFGTQRDSFPTIFPWLMSRHGNYFSHRLAGHPDAGLLLQPFRKPKRIRTAFSPSQLLRLEHAFEKNHYVVGQERKELAATLSLTETQVKVWFQNRRTKYKRLKQEEAESTQDEQRCEPSEQPARSPSPSPNPPSANGKGAHHLNRWRVETNQV